MAPADALLYLKRLRALEARRGSTGAAGESSSVGFEIGPDVGKSPPPVSDPLKHFPQLPDGRRNSDDGLYYAGRFKGKGLQSGAITNGDRIMLGEHTWTEEHVVHMGDRAEEV